MMPYVFGSWLTRRRRRTRPCRTPRSRARRPARDSRRPRHCVPRVPVDGATPLRRHVEDQRLLYEWVVADGERSPLIERSFRWLDEHWPREGPTVISWGDSRDRQHLVPRLHPRRRARLGDGGVATREVDLAWLVCLHRSFQEIAVRYGVPGLPDFLRRADVTATYRQLTGHEPPTWTGTRPTPRCASPSSCSASRVRSAHFGEAEMPADPDDAIGHRALLESMLDGTYLP